MLFVILLWLNSKQCNAFKTRALQVQQYLQTAIPGLEVALNPEKVRFLSGISNVKGKSCKCAERVLKISLKPCLLYQSLCLLTFLIRWPFLIVDVFWNLCCSQGEGALKSGMVRGMSSFHCWYCSYSFLFCFCSLSIVGLVQESNILLRGGSKEYSCSSCVLARCCLRSLWIKRMYLVVLAGYAKTIHKAQSSWHGWNSWRDCEEVEVDDLRGILLWFKIDFLLAN